MIWFDVDGARAYLAQGAGATPSRKLVYRMVRNGLRVSRTGNGGKGDRLFFCAEWIDAYLVGRSEKRNAEAGKASASIENGDGNHGKPTTATG